MRGLVHTLLCWLLVLPGVFCAGLDGPGEVNPADRALPAWDVRGQYSVLGLGEADPKDRSLAAEQVRDHFSEQGLRLQSGVRRLQARSAGGKEVRVSQECLRDVAIWSGAVIDGEEWALRMLDAWGLRQAGTYEGDTIFEGSWPQCSRTNDADTGIRGRHCMTYWAGLGLIDGFGTCLPTTCLKNDVTEFLANNVDIFEDRMPIGYRFLGINASVTHCAIPTQEKNITRDPSAMAAIGVLSFFVLLAIIGTIYDVATMNKREPPKQVDAAPKVQELRIPRPSVTGTLPKKSGAPYPLNGEGSTPYNQNGGRGSFSQNGVHVNPAFDSRTEPLDLPPDYDSKPAPAGHDSVQLPEIHRKPWQPNTGGKFLLAFSVRQHAPRILGYQHAKGSIPCLNAVRFLAFAWIVLGHTWVMGIVITRAPVVANKQTFLGEQWRATQLAVKYHTYPVVSFFILSAMLTTISFLNKLKKRKPDCEMMGIFFFHRFWRLTPVYMLTLMLYTCLFGYFASGPFYNSPEDIPDVSMCKRHWWKNLLYVANLFTKPGEECMGWTWYLNNDFQFYLISPAFLFPLYYIPILGIVLVVLGFCGGMIATIYLNNLAFYDVNPDGSPRVDGFWGIYVVPWTRCTTYFMGMMLGYILWRNNFKFKMNRVGVGFGWVLMIALLLTLTFVDYSEICVSCTPWPDRARAVFESLNNVGFGLVVCWVIFACSTGYGGFINSIFSWSGWLPLARLSYTGYLVHPILIYFYFYQRPTQYYMNDIDQVVLFVAFLFLSLGAAFLLSLFLEVPFGSLEKLMFANTPGNRRKPEHREPLPTTDKATASSNL